MGCASSHEIEAKTRRPYVADRTGPVPGMPRQWLLPHGRPSTFPRESQTFANAVACRKRYEEYSDELDREALSSLERTRSECSGRSSQHTSGRASMITGEDVVPTEEAPLEQGTSLAQLFGAPEAPSAGAPIIDAPPTVFDLINSDGGSDIINSAASDDGCDVAIMMGMPASTVPPQELQHARLHVPDLIHDEVDDTDDGDGIALTIPRGCHPLAGTPAVSPAPSSVASSTRSRHSQASSHSLVLDRLRSKLLRPGSPQ